jgi:hypothetical protein
VRLKAAIDMVGFTARLEVVPFRSRIAEAVCTIAKKENGH